MNFEDTGDEQGKGEFLEENINLTGVNSDSSDKSNSYFKEKSRRGMRSLRTKIKSKLTLESGSSYDQCFSNNNFTSQYEDECPVNYSLKYSETEPCKAAGKCETTKKKFKDFAYYSETDLDQPTDFSLKYAEKNYDDESKSTFNYFNNHKVKFKEYTDYVETDLDQPTDFTLKYRESAEEDIHFYENEEQKSTNSFSSRMVSEDATSPERQSERCASHNETPLMFSRSSSMNSLSSFVHITQSIPDDRSSVVSDFSRMTSGIISPSELPDSPTQTEPSSPKRHKLSLGFPLKPDFLMKQSVFEDDVATYKQEDTPIEFSRATSLSSLNIENPVKRSPAASLVVTKEENQNSLDQVQSEHLKHQVVPEKGEHEKGKFELASVLEVDESLFADCISIDIQINCRKPTTNYGRLMPQDNNFHPRQVNGFPVKPNFRLRVQNENKKGCSSYDGSDDAVHTYHTEGTPANVSHAGSHSDLSTLSILGMDDNSDIETFLAEDLQTVPVVKAETIKNNTKIFSESQSVKVDISDAVKRGVYVNDQPLQFLRKNSHHFMTNETATFATENSPSDNISMRSSLSDLTLNVVDGTLGINRVETSEEPPSHLLSPLRNVSPQSPNSVVFEEGDDAVKYSEEQQNEFLSSLPADHVSESWDPPNILKEKSENKSLKMKSKKDCPSTESTHPVSFDFDSSQPLTPFEEALVEECIRLGMPQKKNQKPSPRKHGVSENSELGHCTFSKPAFYESRHFSGKKFSSNIMISDSEKLKTLNSDHFDLDSSEPLTPFEEVLLEQCIRLGMPQKKNYVSPEEAQSTYPDGVLDSEKFNCHSDELITPLETALLEQCIRLGMPQRKTQKKEGTTSLEETHKGISSLSAHLNRLKLNLENEKDKDFLRKGENCPCGKRHNNRRKTSSCKKLKNRTDHFKTEC